MRTTTRVVIAAVAIVAVALLIFILGWHQVEMCVDSENPAESKCTATWYWGPWGPW